MPESITTILERLGNLADYGGRWDVLRNESALLHDRIAELRERETRLDDLLVIALVGGSGVGKSTLLNALAGDELAKMSEFRPCTSVPTIYHPPGARLEFSQDWHHVSGSALESLVIVDTPDSDTIVTEHRETTLEVLAMCDLILVCADGEKYLDEATWSLLRPLKNERTLVCIETKATEVPSVQEHWRQRLEENGLKTSGYFRVNSRRTLDRKLSGQPAGDDEYDFADLERFLHEGLTVDRIRGIKRSNAAGLLSKTLLTLEERITSREGSLNELRKALDAADTEVSKESFEIVRSRLFAEPHLWTYALGREMSLRSKGIVGTLFRLLEALRSLPARMSGWSFWQKRAGAGHQAASLLTDGDLVAENLDLSSRDLKAGFLAKRGGVSLEFARAGFNTSGADTGFEEFSEELNTQIAAVLSGPARDRIVAKARALTSWPVAIAADTPPLIFVAVSGYNVVAEYFWGAILGAGFFVHAGTVLTIILALEMFALSLVSRYFAWSARQAGLKDLRVALIGNRFAFQAERDSLDDAVARIEEIHELRDAVLKD